MKRLTNLHMMALALTFIVLAGTSVFAADQSNYLDESRQLLSTSDFSALSGISADPMNEAELDKVQGKYLPPKCGRPGVKCVDLRILIKTFILKRPPWGPWCLSCPPYELVSSSGGVLGRINEVAFNPQPEPPAVSRGKMIQY